MKTIIVWFRNDLRLHDHPALATAAQDADVLVPVFIFDTALLNGQSSGSNRNRFLLECLQDLQKGLTARGANLIVRTGSAASELSKLAAETDASAVYYSADYTPYAIARDKQVQAALAQNDIEFRSVSGRLAVGALDKLHTQLGKPHKVFTPFWKNWLQVERRPLAELPAKLSIPARIAVGDLPVLKDISNARDLSPDVLRGGETAARDRLKDFLEHDVADYVQTNNDMAGDHTSRLSAYLHFGCLSVREIETMLPDSAGARAWHRQLAWREFYHYVLYKFPRKDQEFQERYRSLKWGTDTAMLQAWQQGLTGYPIVDAAMRQLSKEGWMHNRARLIVGSFLTKDLWIDWRLGEAYFMKMLIDGDTANNNGNWQWIASVGVDPAPVFRRLYNPSSQQKNYDPTGAYVRRFVPELAGVPDKYLAEPWTMPEDLQQQVGCVIGTDYPAPIVDHKQARLAALDHYRNTKVD